MEVAVEIPPVWRRRRPRRLREGEGEVLKSKGLKSVAVHELEGLAGIGGEEKHAPVRVLSRGMWDEGDVLLHVDDFSDSDIVGGRRRRHRPVVPAEDARDGDRCRHGGDSLGSGRGYVGLKASLTCAGGGLPLVLARFCEGGKANVW